MPAFPDLKIYPNPQLGPAEVKLSRGLNLNDNLLEMDREDACILKNLVWNRNTLQRRKGFQLDSTETWGDKWRGGIEFIDRWGNRRLLVGTDAGKILEIQSASAHATIKSGLATLQEIHFAPAFGALFAVNGQDAPRRIDGNSVAGTACTDRTMGPPVPITGVGIAAGAAGILTGTYLGIVTAVREESGVKVLESDWSNLATITLAAKQRVYTWNATADARVTHYYIYGTDATGSVMYYLGKVAVGTLTYTDNTSDALVVGNRPAPLQYRNGAPPVGEFIVHAGGRLHILALASQGNAFQSSIAGVDSFIIENFPTYDTVNLKFYSGGNHQTILPGLGKIKAARALGETGAQSKKANDLWVAQETSCYLLPESNPNNPLQEISSQLGCIGQRAHAQYGQGIFFQSRRGVEFWPGSGQVIYLVSDQITPIFTGGGNQNLTANQSDTDITYAVDGDTLLVTVKDDSTKACANKVYCLDLLKFMKSFQSAAGPGDLEGKALSRWAGPWQGNGYGLFIPQANRGLILLDNQDLTILYRHATSYSDWIGGANVTAALRILTGPAMQEFKMARNKLHYLDLFAFTNTDSMLRIIAENGLYDQSDILVEATNYAFPWQDITWQDLTWQYNTWHSEVCMPWSAVGNFFQFDFTNADPSGDFVFYAYALRYSTAIRTRTFR
jgi:hypothetical protein